MFALNQFIKRHLAIALIGSAGVIASIIVSLIVYRLVAERLQYEFESETEERIVTIGNETLTITELMHGLSGLYAASQHVSADSFHAFSKKILSDIEYVDAAVWLPKLNASQRKQFEQQLKARGVTPYRVQQFDTDQPSVTGKQGHTFPVHYYYSKINETIPYVPDLASNASIANAMQKALELNDFAATPVSIPAWKSGASATTLVIQPIYPQGSDTTTQAQRQRNLLGFVGLYINIDRFFSSALEKHGHETPGMDLYLYESHNTPTSGHHFYLPDDHHIDGHGSKHTIDELRSGYHVSRKFYFIDSEWELISHPHSGYYVAYTSWEPYFTFSLSLLLTTLVSALFLTLQNRRNYAELQVQSRTNELKRSESRLQKLHIITSSNMTFADKVDSLLRLGLQELELDIGILSHVEGDSYNVVYAISPDNSITNGATFELGSTYCCDTLINKQVTAIQHAKQGKWRKHPCYDLFQLESYIGTPVIVNDETYGTLNFTSPLPHQQPFNPSDLEFVKLMAQWIGIELENIHFENKLSENNALLASISRAQNHYIAAADDRAIFDGILTDVLNLTDSKLGFIGGIDYEDHGKPCLNTYALLDANWNEQERRYYEQHVPQAMNFTNLDTLFGNTIQNSKILISNDPQDSHHAPGLPADHPPLHNYMSIPLFYGDTLVGVIGIANREAGYNSELSEYLEPLIASCGNLISAIQSNQSRIQAEMAVQHSRRMLHLVLDNIPVRVFWKDTNGKYLGCNQLFSHDAGFTSPKEVIGKTDNELPNTYLTDIYQKFDQEILDNDESSRLNFEEAVTLQNGETVWLEMNKLSLTDINGKTFGVLGSYRDITDRINAKSALIEQKEKITHILESSADAYITIGFDWIIHFANQRSQTLLNLKPKDIVGKKLRHAAPGIADLFATPIYYALHDHIKQIEIKYFSPTQKWLEANINPTEDGISINFKDISEQLESLNELREKESTIRAIVDTVIDAIITVDGQGHINSFNRAAEQIFGLSEKQALNKTFTELLADEQNNLDYESLIGSRQELNGLRSDGSTFPMELAVNELFLNNTYYYTMVIRDLAEQKRSSQLLSETLGIKNAILDSANFSIIATDLNGIIRSFNTSAETMLGYTADEVIGKYTPSLIHDSHEVVQYAANLSQEYQHTIEPGFDVIVYKARQGLADEREWTYIRKDGSSFPVLLSVTAVRNESNELIGFLSIAADITERKKMQQMKDEFVSVVSHELRTPLTSIRGSLGLLTGGAMGELPKEIDSLLDIAGKNTERLLLLINDILDISKIESNKMVFDKKSIAVRPLLQQAINNNATYAKQYEVQFKISQCDEQLHIYADEQRMMQVLTNLMSNAAKFSHPMDSIDLSAIRNGNSVRISVLDHGIGIPEKFQRKIFDKFTQVDSSDSRHTGGTGLGMSISRAIVEEHGGTIDFVSHEGVGSSFFFDIPISDDILTRVSSERDNDTDANQRHILICSDDSDSASMLAMLLATNGFRVTIAHNLAEAHEQLARHRFVAMTLDLLLPDNSAIALLKEIRQAPATCKLPVVVMSISNKNRHQLHGNTTGIIDWIEKPVDKQRLLSTINYAINGQRQFARILHIEDDPDIQQIVSLLLTDSAKVTTVNNLKQAYQQLATENFDLVLLDIQLPDGSGLDLLPTIQQTKTSPPVVVFSIEELTAAAAKQVSKTLVKSRTSNQQLLDTINACINSNHVYTLH